VRSLLFFNRKTEQCYEPGGPFRIYSAAAAVTPDLNFLLSLSSFFSSCYLHARVGLAPLEFSWRARAVFAAIKLTPVSTTVLDAVPTFCFN
jgi:hypothetical protein